MSKRTRYIWLATIAVIGGILAIGAWQNAESDNQGGYVVVLIFFVVLLFIYVPLAMRSITRGGGRKQEGSD
jgi:uncharacterized membrane protein YozB (DUF420 family)